MIPGNVLAQTETAMIAALRRLAFFTEFEDVEVWEALRISSWRIVPPKDASRAEKKNAAWVEEILRDVVDEINAAGGIFPKIERFFLGMIIGALKVGDRRQEARQGVRVRPGQHGGLPRRATDTRWWG